jgi:hypothetical protein
MRIPKLRTREEKAKGIRLVRLEISCSQSFARKLREIAGKEGRPTSALIRRTLQLWLKDREARNLEG